MAVHNQNENVYKDRIVDTYNPFKTLDADAWLALDEQVRLDLVKQWHSEANDLLEEEGANESHAAIHVAVENQLAQGEQPTVQVVARLLRQGLDRHEAVHAISAVLAEIMYELVNSEREDAEEHYGRLYRRKLEKLTAKRWRKGQI